MLLPRSLSLLLVLLLPASAAARPDSGRIERLRGAIGDVLEREGVPGAGVALVDRSGVIWAGGVGVADVDTGRAVTADTLFRVASITKSFVALAVARLHERGVLDLGQALSDVLPDVDMTNRWARESPITLAHVLEHSAGFDDMRFNELGGPGAEREPLLAVLARNPRSRVARWRPGTRFSYANPGYTVAAAAVERATGRDYRDVIRDDVAAPMGIRDVHFGLTASVEQRLARGYVRPRVAGRYVGIYHHPAGTMMTTAAELGAFVHRWLVRSEAVVSASMLDRIERSETLQDSATDMSYGLGNYGDPRHGTLCRGHDGGLPGYLSTYRYCPDIGVGYVVLTNATFSVRAHSAIDALVFEAASEGIELPPPPEAPPSASERRRVAGYYAVASPRNELLGFLDRLLHGVVIDDEGGVLIARPLLGGQHRLVRTGPGRYRFQHDGAATIRFTRDARGVDTLVIGTTQFERGREGPARLRLRAVRAAMEVMRAALLVFAALLAVWLLTGLRPRDLHLLAWPALSAGSLLLAVVVVGYAEFGDLGRPGLASISVCALTALHAAFAAIGVALPVWSLARQRSAARLLVAVPAAGASLMCAGFAAWLAIHGIIGLRTWMW